MREVKKAENENEKEKETCQKFHVTFWAIVKLQWVKAPPIQKWLEFELKIYEYHRAPAIDKTW